MNTKICSTSGCERKVLSKGLCANCYQKAWRAARSAAKATHTPAAEETVESQSASTAIAVLETKDIVVMDGQEVVSHHRIAENLGVRADHVKRKIDELVEKSEKFRSFGILPSTGEKSGGRGQPTTHVWLNEKQALFVAMSYESKNALDLRFASIEVFVAYRQGKLQPTQDLLYEIEPKTPGEKASTVFRIYCEAARLPTHLREKFISDRKEELATSEAAKAALRDPPNALRFIPPLPPKKPEPPKADAEVLELHREMTAPSPVSKQYKPRKRPIFAHAGWFVHQTPEASQLSERDAKSLTASVLNEMGVRQNDDGRYATARLSEFRVLFSVRLAEIRRSACG